MQPCLGKTPLPKNDRWINFKTFCEYYPSINFLHFFRNFEPNQRSYSQNLFSSELKNEPNKLVLCKTWPERLAAYNRSSLLEPFVSYEENEVTFKRN
jgi:hypothetical protein